MDPVAARITVGAASRPYPGESVSGDVIGFQMSLARLPAWDPQDQAAEGTLEMTAYPADEVFREQLDLLEVFTGLAVQAETGILVTPVG